MAIECIMQNFTLSKLRMYVRSRLLKIFRFITEKMLTCVLKCKAFDRNATQRKKKIDNY